MSGRDLWHPLKYHHHWIRIFKLKCIVRILVLSAFDFSQQLIARCLIGRLRYLAAKTRWGPILFLDSSQHSTLSKSFLTWLSWSKYSLRHQPPGLDPILERVRAVSLVSLPQQYNSKALWKTCQVIFTTAAKKELSFLSTIYIDKVARAEVRTLRWRKTTSHQCFSSHTGLERSVYRKAENKRRRVYKIPCSRIG